MALLSPKDAAALKERFQKELKSDVNITLFTSRTGGLLIPGRECGYCDDTQKLLEEVVALSPKLHLNVFDLYSQVDEARSRKVERIPAIILGADGQSNLKYYGIPTGYEFLTILEDLVTLSRGVSPLKLDTRKKLRLLDKELRIQVFVTPT